MPEPKIKIGSKYRENLERVKGFIKEAVGNSSLRDFKHVYRDKDKEIIVEPRKRDIMVRVYYKTGIVERQCYSIPYSEL